MANYSDALKHFKQCLDILEQKHLPTDSGMRCGVHGINCLPYTINIYELITPFFPQKIS